ncbi:bifunctional glutamate N-acetyltransferase/amino-acid acetyltransferase ArgJ [bacterium]|nr:bifunctional glutamate N-acetyltransferase/amino-acid acetyltransferase ArgJ [bacterium]MBU3956425.1 bifunctional glutamate N-acetyltransferase/amino-acid acetyltransferase ArgJ [bacterium]
MKKNKKTYFPEGFLIGGAASGMKKSGKDIGVIFCPGGFKAAAVFTKNRFAAAPVLISRKHLPDGRVLVANSKFANAATGARGFRDATETCAFAAGRFGVKADEVLVASTGVIGAFLPMAKIKKGIVSVEKTFAEKPVEPEDFADSVMTTDTYRKISSHGNFWACAKGSGMINPDMATFLCFILTDARVSSYPRMKKIFREAAGVFNRMSVDGEMSTNDSVFLLSSMKKTVSETKFKKDLTNVCNDIAAMIIDDGEGRTKVIEITVASANSASEAHHLADFLAASPLIKTAFNGESPNWGRILSRTGASGVSMNQKKVSVYICGVLVYRGAPVRFDEKALRELLRKKEVSFKVDLSVGRSECVFSTTDFSEDYIRINAGYLS